MDPLGTITSSFFVMIDKEKKKERKKEEEKQKKNRLLFYKYFDNVSHQQVLEVFFCLCGLLNKKLRKRENDVMLGVVVLLRFRS